MKKTIIGLAAMGCMLFAGQQATADTLQNTLAGMAPISTAKMLMDYGYEATTNTGITYGILDLTSAYVPENAGIQSWTNSLTDRVYVVFSGLQGASTNTTTSGSNTGGQYAIYESTVYDDLNVSSFAAAFTAGPNSLVYNDGIFNTGAGSSTLLLTGNIGDSHYAVTGAGELNFGFDAYGDGTSGPIVADFLSSILSVHLAGHFQYLDPSIGGWNVKLTDGSAFASSVPEPTTMLLFGVGLIGLAGVGRRKLSK
jgi:hypothetical protein